MTVVGYNYNTESDEPCLGIEVRQPKEGGKKPTSAVLYIGEGQLQMEITLIPKELHAFIGQCNTILLQLEELSNTGLVRINPRQCSIVDISEVGLDENPTQCPNMAVWSYNGAALCYTDMHSMSAMNSDNAEVFAPALATQGEE